MIESIFQKVFNLLAKEVEEEMAADFESPKMHCNGLETHETLCTGWEDEQRLNCGTYDTCVRARQI